MDYMLYLYTDDVLLYSLFSIVSSLLYYLLFSMLFALFHNTLSARCSNQLRTSGSCFSLTIVLCVSQSRIFLILSQFIILPYILPLVIRIVWLYQFSSSSYYLFLLWRLLLLILLFYVLVLNTRNIAKFWICDPWYCKEEFLILDFKFWNTFRCNG